MVLLLPMSRLGGADARSHRSGDQAASRAVADVLARGLHDPGALALRCEEARRNADRPIPVILELGAHVPDGNVIPHDPLIERSVNGSREAPVEAIERLHRAECRALLPRDARSGDLLYSIISQRHEKASTIITTNLAFKDWGTVFPGAACAPPRRPLHPALPRPRHRRRLVATTARRERRPHRREASPAQQSTEAPSLTPRIRSRRVRAIHPVTPRSDSSGSSRSSTLGYERRDGRQR
ncbi:MAG: ATP-binding protein [Labilithrix sp.]|nr:ATP-binding protein [Labilithrix sp.]MCW5816430.1 ATP-binding protein [Labilithrix sp.]